MDPITLFVADGCSLREAKKFLSNGSLAFPVSDYDIFRSRFHQIELPALEDIEAGDCFDTIKIITFKGKRYLLKYVLEKNQGDL